MCLRGSTIRRVLLVGSGHMWSTLDVQRGLLEGFQAAGYQVFAYDLHTRLEAARGWVDYANKVIIPATGQEAPPDDWQPSDEDVIYQAGIGAVTEALRVNADAVVVVCGLLFAPPVYVMLQRAGFPVFLFGTESPYDDDMFRATAELATAVSVNEPASVATVQALTDAPVSYMPLGYNPGLHLPGFGRDSNLPAHDVVFVGNIYPSRQAFFEAIDWDGLGIDLGIYGVTATVPEDAPVRKWIQHDGMVPNPVAAALYTKASIVLNLFRTEQFGQNWELRGQVRGEAISPRMIEAAAMGAFMVSEEREQVREVFGAKVPTFRTPDDAARVLAYWLARPDARREAGMALPRLVAPHSYTVRAMEIVEALEAAVRGQALTAAA